MATTMVIKFSDNDDEGKVDVKLTVNDPTGMKQNSPALRLALTCLKRCLDESDGVTELKIIGQPSADKEIAK